MICYAFCPSCGSRTRTTERVRERAPSAQCVACNCELVWIAGEPCLEGVVTRVEQLERGHQVLAAWIGAVVLCTAVAIGCVAVVLR